MSPKTLSTVSQSNRNTQLEKFLVEIQENKNIDPQKFWKFREFYSPGHFIFNRNGLTEKEKNNAFAELGIDSDLLKDDFIFLRFKSMHINSVEALTDKSSIEDLKFENSGEIVNQGLDYVLVQINSNTLYLYFVLPGDKLKKTNGFLDYAEKDVELVKDKYWIVISKITLDK